MCSWSGDNACIMPRVEVGARVSSCSLFDLIVLICQVFGTPELPGAKWRCLACALSHWCSVTPVPLNLSNAQAT